LPTDGLKAELVERLQGAILSAEEQEERGSGSAGAAADDHDGDATMADAAAAEVEAPPLPPPVSSSASSAATDPPATATATANASEKEKQPEGGGKQQILLGTGGRDDMDEEEEDEDVDMPLTTTTTPAVVQPQLTSKAALPATTATAVAVGGVPVAGTADASAAARLIDRIIVPSPYPQHNAGPASSRFRNALQRVTTAPLRDVEAWQALMTEVGACYRDLLMQSSVHNVDVETHARLDWIESCYGSLLRNFPYAAPYWTQISEILMDQSARAGEERGPVQTYGIGVPKRALLQESKLERILVQTLGVTFGDENDEGSGGGGSTTTTLLGGMCVWCVELWLLYVKKRARDANRRAQETIGDVAERPGYVRRATLDAYETAVKHAAFCHNNHLLWEQYVEFVKSWVPSPNEMNALIEQQYSAEQHALQQQQMQQLRSIYQRLVCLPMTGLDQMWQEYERFEKSQSEALAAALIAEFAPKYQHARNVYLERGRVYGATQLELGRLATEPVSSSAPPTSASSSSSGGKSGTADTANTGAAATAAAESEADYAAKMDEEYKLLKLWKVRCSYERSNPERLKTSTELQQRVRTAYKELICVFTRHPECWQMWSTWELVQETKSCVGTESVKNDGGGATVEGKEPPPSVGSIREGQRARAVLQLAQTHIVDCTLLAMAEAQIVELYHKDDPSACIAVMEQFLSRSPNTLAFVVCQQMVRRYRGIDEARAVFARARRVLTDTRTDGGVGAEKKNSDDTAAAVSSEGIDGTKTSGDADKGTSAKHLGDENGNRRWMVTNRLDASITGKSSTKGKKSAAGDHTKADADETANKAVQAGAITWHLYASHAVIEHRLNRLPEVAARVFELGLRKHASFLTKPPYVLRYAQLLLELGDTMNLRALLTRAVAACEAHEDTHHAALAAFWDMSLRFESVLTADPTSAGRLHDIERKRHHAVFGPSVEDVATGGSLLLSDVPLIGAQKATISEQLVRTEGYDVSSSIVSGMSREVDFLEVMGLWGGNDAPSSSFARQKTKQDTISEISGGKSDTSYQKRRLYHNMAAAGMTADSGAGEGGVVGAAGAKLLSARERMQQGAAAAPGQAQPTAMMLAIQQSPDWVRELLLLLPASRLRVPIVPKAPPHLIEMALSALRQNQLPAERPADTSNGLSKLKRGISGGDSSDEEEGSNKAGGYGSQFRSRKRARMMQEMGPSA